MKHFSRIISTIFHPLLMPTIGLFLIFNTGSYFSFIPADLQHVIYLIVILSTLVLPISIIPLMLLLGSIKSIYMTDRRERLKPVFFTGVFYFIGYFFLSKIPIVPNFIEVFVLSSLVTIYSAMAITFFWKISMHMIGIGGLSAAILILSLRYGLDLWLLFTLAIIISGAIGSARLYLKAHTPAQLYTGYLLGFSIVLCGIYFMA